MSVTAEVKVTETVIVEVAVPGTPGAPGEPGAPGAPGATFPPLAADLLGLAANMPRAGASNGGSASPSGQINLHMMTVHTAGNTVGPLIMTGSGGGTLMTYNRFALYRVDEAELVRLAITAHLGASFAANTAIAPAWDAPVELNVGDRVAVAHLAITTGSMPSLRGSANAGALAANITPWLARQVSGATELPAVIPFASTSYQATFLAFAALL